MKNKKVCTCSKAGGVLLMAMLVMLTLSVLAVGLFHYSTTNAVETVRQDHSRQAFWIAESGLQDAIQRIRYDDQFRDDAADFGPQTYSVTITNTASQTMRYDVTVTNTPIDRYLEYYVFDIVSTGWKNGMNRRIHQTVTSRPGFISAIMAPNNINVAANTIVSGPIMVLGNGELILDDKIPPGQDLDEDFDIIILDDGASINQKKSGANEGSDYDIVDLPVPDKFPEMPDFSKYLADAAAKPAPLIPGPVTNLVTDLTLGDQFLNYPDGLVTYKIIGSGRLVNTGDITIVGNSVLTDDVSSDVSIFSASDVIVGKKTDFGNNTLLYAYDQIYFGDGSYCPGNSAILADGNDDGPANIQDDIIMGGQSEFYGIVFADEGNVVIQAGSGGSANTRIVGTVISGNDVDMNSNAEIIFDTSVIYDGTEFDLLTVFDTGVVETIKKWKELPPL